MARQEPASTENMTTGHEHDKLFFSFNTFSVCFLLHNTLISVVFTLNSAPFWVSKVSVPN